MTTKSILVLVASNRRRGAEVFGERLSSGLGEAGWRVDFVALQGVASDRIVSAIPLSTNGRSRKFDLRTVHKLRNHIRDTRPAMILANGGATLRYAVAAARTVRAAPALAYSSIGEPRYWLRSKNHTRIQRFLHHNADVILAVSQVTATQLVEVFGVDRDRVHVAHTGVPDSYFVQHQASGDGLRLIFLGSLSTEKNPMGAVDVTLLLKDRRAVELRLVGDGPLANEIASVVARTETSDIIELTGSVDDVTPHLAWADLLILTSRTEGLPGAVLEAAAAGVPTIAYDVGGTRETMEPGTTGVLIPSGDIDKMVTAIDRLSMARDDLAEMGIAATQFVRDGFTMDRSIGTYDDILTRALTMKDHG